MSEDEAAVRRRKRNEANKRCKARQRAGILPANGGARPGAGRKPGDIGKKTAENIAKAEATGVMPLEVMLNEMRRFYDQAQKERAKGKEADRQVIKECSAAAVSFAKDAAPYLHPKLQAIEFSGNVRLTHEAALDQLDD